MSGNNEHPDTSLPDAVMLRVGAEPVPSASRAFAAAACRGAPVDAFTALATAWRLATLRTRPVPGATRIRAAALALGAGGLLATSSAVALAGVVNVARQVASQPSRAPQLEPARPTERPAGSWAPEPSAPPVLVITRDDGDGLERPHPRQVAAATPTPAPTPDSTARPTTRSDQGGDGSGDSSGAGTPRPTATPGGLDGSGDGGPDTRATPTPAPSSSPAPEPSDGADGGSSSSDSASSGG